MKIRCTLARPGVPHCSFQSSQIQDHTMRFGCFPFPPVDSSQILLRLQLATPRPTSICLSLMPHPVLCKHQQDMPYQHLMI